MAKKKVEKNNTIHCFVYNAAMYLTPRSRFLLMGNITRPVLVTHLAEHTRLARSRCCRSKMIEETYSNGAYSKAIEGT